MFMPETEDMLPRAAPRPAAAVPMGHNEEIVKPTVPEVSILFGQAPQQQQQQQLRPQQQQETTTTFASWKKQLLPRVNFSPVLATELGPASPPVPSTAPVCNDYNNYLSRSRGIEVDRSTPTVNSNLCYAVNVPHPFTRETFPSTPQNHCPPHYVQGQSPAIATDVLTICAGTQTEPESVASRRDSLSAIAPELGHLANKSDLRELLVQLDLMRQEQQHLRRLCESLVQQQQQQQCVPKTFMETSTQCDILNVKSNAMVKRITPVVHDYIVEEDERSTPYEGLPRAAAPPFQSPRAVPPMAQSTGYRPNTPQPKQSPAANNPLMNAVLQKPNTEKSLVMNELARKYLPQRQITELMDELRLSPTTTPTNGVVNNANASAGIDTTPLRRIDNFHQSPSNISNASYVYLKKYRLLPEQRMSNDQVKLHNPESPVAPTPQSNQPMLDLDNIRNQPKLI
ncbi:uncharacterized protein LOC133844737 [Drosophila sulfurigaster albostrigata]|uniref:uncharacterized protein LOC133844737 n=1 Tax=Drosophila sulfurigaster albostrigata TaxID=89887 RepID=UPI002D218C5B|nr:uncharacterized protein LOC133844737 [Drosophila sulfurigaster albostrigata]